MPADIIETFGPFYPSGGTSGTQTVTLTSAGNGTYTGTWTASGALVPELINDADIYGHSGDQLKESDAVSGTEFTMTLTNVTVS